MVMMMMMMIHYCLSCCLKRTKVQSVFEFLIVLTASLVSGDNQDNLLFRLKSCNYDGFDDDDDDSLEMWLREWMECKAEEARRGFVQKGAVLLVPYSNARCLPNLT